LDGETDWKLRKALGITQSGNNWTSPEMMLQVNASVVANPPTDQIYDFKGYM
jgi:hypothetical protein